MQTNHKCIKEESTKIKGNINFTLNISDWTPYLPEGENQSDISMDTSACLTESRIHNLERYMNYLIMNKLLPAYHLAAIKNLGFINAAGKFKASVRFSAKIDGTTADGNYVSAVADSVLKNDGIVPDSDWPFDPKMTFDEYYSTLTQREIDKAKIWLSLFSGDWDWLIEAGGQNNILNDYVSKTPIQVVIHCCPGWNTEDPILTCPDNTLQHGVDLYGANNMKYQFMDTYVPFLKEFDSSYYIPYATGMVINPIKFSYNFTKTLKQGDADPDVVMLQRALNQDPDTMVAQIGAGSPGLETDIFGLETLAAVKKFQEKYKEDILTPVNADSPTGFVGSHTIAKLNALYLS